MELPEGVTIPAETSRSPGYRQSRACQLLKSIYGLKQSPQAWYGRIHQCFLSNSFSRGDADHSLFIHYNPQVILLLYVDDLVLAAPTLNPIDWIRTKLNQGFDMTDRGEIHSFLGLEIVRNRSCRTLFLSQRPYIHRILHAHGIKHCNQVNSPADPHIWLEKSSPTFEATDTQRRRYRSALGSLMYAMLGTRPDISYSISKVSQYRTNTNPIQGTAGKRIFQYLAGTLNRGLYFGIQEHSMRFTGRGLGIPG